MRTKAGVKTPMKGAVDTIRRSAAALVDREERRVGSRMLAYYTVSQTVGTSSEWLRKLVSSSGAPEPRFSIGLNILEVYRRVCERVEQAADHERRLKGEIDALIESVVRVVDSDQRTEEGPTAP